MFMAQKLSNYKKKLLTDILSEDSRWHFSAYGYARMFISNFFIYF